MLFREVFALSEQRGLTVHFHHNLTQKGSLMSRYRVTLTPMVRAEARQEEIFMPHSEKQYWHKVIRLAATPEATSRRKPLARDKPWGLGSAWGA